MQIRTLGSQNALAKADIAPAPEHSPGRRENCSTTAFILEVDDPAAIVAPNDHRAALGVHAGDLPERHRLENGLPGVLFRNPHPAARARA